MSVYRVIIDIKSAMLSTVLELIDNSDGIHLDSVHDAADPGLPPAPLPPEPKVNGGLRYANGWKQKGISGVSIIEGVLRSGPATLDELKSAFVNAGYARTSTGNYVNRLLKANRIVRGTHGRFNWSGGNED
jgi:hypothetical protein